jgi:hypothetical protein
MVEDEEGGVLLEAVGGIVAIGGGDGSVKHSRLPLRSAVNDGWCRLIDKPGLTPSVYALSRTRVLDA